MLLRVGDINPMGEKDKAYINCYKKYGYVTVFYLVVACYKKMSWNIIVSYLCKLRRRIWGLRL